MNDEQQKTDTCPCGSQKPYEECCSPLHQHSSLAKTAEQLMRSRYTAFAKANHEYLEQTNHPSSIHKYDTPDNRTIASNLEWIGLEILATENGQETDEQGIVDFIARYSVHGNIHSIRERSTFIKEDGRWWYLDGKSLQLPKKNTDKPGRNDPCPCGSGKKYKKCCG